MSQLIDWFENDIVFMHCRGRDLFLSLLVLYCINTNIVFWRPWWRGRWIHRLITRIILPLSLDVAVLVLKVLNRCFQEFGMASRRYTD